MELIVFLLAAYGISNIMVHSSIFEWWRILMVKISPNFLGDLFQCMMCLPFWVGIALSVIFGSVVGTEFDMSSVWLATFIDGCLASGGVWLIHTLQEKLEK